jgi:hypothetical protein
MKKSKKIVIITVSIVAALLVLLGVTRVSMKLFAHKLESEIFPLKDPVSVINSEYKRPVVCVDWIYDINDKNKVAGASDYVFVAEVKKVVGTGYTDVKYYDGYDFDADPFTRYEIRVLENLKGQLTTKKDIPLTKHDGVHFFGKNLSALEGDNLPDEGECYIFLCNADEDGELVIGRFSYFCDIYLCRAEEYTGKERIIDVYRDAVVNMDESVRFGEDFKSKYEVQ